MPEGGYSLRAGRGTAKTLRDTVPLTWGPWHLELERRGTLQKGRLGTGRLPHPLLLLHTQDTSLDSSSEGLPPSPATFHLPDCNSPVGHTGKVKEQKGETQRQLQAVTYVFRKQPQDWSKRLAGYIMGLPVSSFWSHLGPGPLTPVR